MTVVRAENVNYLMNTSALQDRAHTGPIDVTTQLKWRVSAVNIPRHMLIGVLLQSMRVIGSLYCAFVTMS